jgi:hypothetical protein
MNRLFVTVQFQSVAFHVEGKWSEFDQHDDNQRSKSAALRQNRLAAKLFI